MNFRQKLALYLSLLTALCTPLLAQAVDIPDHNLRAAIADALGSPRGSPITRQDMHRLTHLSAYNKGIIDLSGLETAINLKDLALGQNALGNLLPLAHLTNLRRLVVPDCQLNDINPLSSLTQLMELNVRGNPISDLSSLANLTALKYLDLGHCLILDVSPLSNLVNLQGLQLNHNQIVDVRPLSKLTSLSKLEIHNNLILDHSPIDSLSLDIFHYDQTCEMPPLPLEPRLENRHYPSIFSRWLGGGWGGVPAVNRPELSFSENVALHDLWFGAGFGLKLFEHPSGFVLRGRLDEAISQRDGLLAHNPNMVFLMTLTFRGADLDRFPEDWPYWIRDKNGRIFRGYSHDGIIKSSGLIDFTHPDVQDRIIREAIAISKCGLFDGVIIDYWSETVVSLAQWDGHSVRVFRTLEAEQRARDNILKGIRAHTPPYFLIMGNVNRDIIPRTAPYINGGFMETITPGSDTGEILEIGLATVENSLKWLDTNLREPRINGLEGWTIPNEPPDGPNNLRWMRAITTLSLTHSDGYVVYTSAEHSHNHYWYDFWDADIGRPVGSKAQLYQEIEGLYLREYTNGWAVYNHSGSEQQITLPELAVGVASRLEGNTHTLSDIDGEMYLRVKPANPADVNGDGVVNILDLTLVAQGFGTGNPEADVNGDGVVNVFDLVFVANQF